MGRTPPWMTNVLSADVVERSPCTPPMISIWPLRIGVSTTGMGSGQMVNAPACIGFTHRRADELSPPLDEASPEPDDDPLESIDAPDAPDDPPDDAPDDAPDAPELLS